MRLEAHEYVTLPITIKNSTIPRGIALAIVRPQELQGRGGCNSVISSSSLPDGTALYNKQLLGGGMRRFAFDHCLSAKHDQIEKSTRHRKNVPNTR